MTQKRAYERKKRRFLVEFKLEGAPCTGFTNDVSPSGMFIRSTRLPTPGTFVTVNLHLPEERRVVLRGKVVRSVRVPPALSRLIPNGFALHFSDTPEEYFQFFATL